MCSTGVRWSKISHSLFDDNRCTSPHTVLALTKGKYRWNRRNQKNLIHKHQHLRRVTGENTLRIWMKEVETVDYYSYMKGRDFPSNPEYSSNYNSNGKRIDFPFSLRIILFFTYPGWCLSTGNSHPILGYSESSQSIPFQRTINDVLLLSSFQFDLY